ncbi:DUF1297 domain-containing protein [Candidatus Micrarchaeota archaeon]|nr:DUF1297 domain-containing protein [Candidatus Micrarchaeota archaeon]
MEYKISTLGSHSALDVCDGAKKEGLSTIVVTQTGRDKTYSQYYKSRKRKTTATSPAVGVVDELIALDNFKEIINPSVQSKLKHSIFVPNRSFAVYVGYDNIEQRFNAPIFGNKFLLRAEERTAPKNQHYLLERADIRTPKVISSPEKIDRLCIIKVNEAKRSYERAFFLASNHGQYVQKSQELISQGKIKSEDLKNAKIEEYVVGAQFNLNFFYSPVQQELELLGVDMRRQTNLDGYLRMPADVQLDLLKHSQPSTIEVGHVACTLRESLLEQVFELGERFVETSQKEYPATSHSNGSAKGIVGPFALQGMFVEEGKEEFVCFDVSMRMPGSPGTRFTPYSEYLFGQSISFGRRIAIEIKDAQKAKVLEDVIS